MPARFRILIIDDAPDQRRALGQALAPHFEVIAARSGHDGLKKIPAVEPDALIVTRQITDIDTEEFMQTLRAMREYRETLVIFTSERAQHESIDPDRPVVYMTVSDADTKQVGQALVDEIRRRDLIPRKKTSTLDDLRAHASRGTDTVPDAETAHNQTPPPGGGHRHTANHPVTEPPRRKDGKARIMVVDDEVDVQTMFRIALTPQHRVYTACNGLDAMKQAQLYRPDLFIVDWMMPMVSGPQLIRMLRQSPVFAHTPVIVVTAKTQAPQQQMLDQLGVNCYMSKPVNMEELEMEVERKLEEGHHAHTVAHGVRRAVEWEG